MSCEAVSMRVRALGTLKLADSPPDRRTVVNASQSASFSETRRKHDARIAGSRCQCESERFVL